MLFFQRERVQALKIDRCYIHLFNLLGSCPEIITNVYSVQSIAMQVIKRPPDVSYDIPLTDYSSPKPPSRKRSRVADSEGRGEDNEGLEDWSSLLWSVTFTFCRHSSFVPDKQSLYKITRRRERKTMYRQCFSVLWAVFTVCTQNTPACCRFGLSVGASHAFLWANVVEHCLDEFWEVVVVLPAPVFPCVCVVEVHWPAVGCNEKNYNKKSILYLAMPIFGCFNV